jgi:hypothetical protein
MNKNTLTPAVSSLGRFRNGYGATYYPYARNDGYVPISIGKDTYLMHRLVAMAFIARQDGHDFVNHRNMDRADNRVENLEWCNHEQNMQHSYATNSERISSANKTAKPIHGRPKGATEWTWYASANEAARVLGLLPVQISAAALGKSQHLPYEFEFAPPTEPDVIDGEEWRVTVGGGHISSFGRVRNYAGVVTTPSQEASGYRRVKIDNQRHSVHRLVAEAFLGAAPEGCTQVNHKDGDPGNNHVTNLEWTTRSENIRHSYENNTNRRARSDVVAPTIFARRVGDMEWTRYDGPEAASRATSVRRSYICTRARRGQRSGGYEFRVATLEEETLPGEEWRELDFLRKRARSD